MTAQIINLAARRQVMEEAPKPASDPSSRSAMGLRLWLVRVAFDMTEQEAANTAGVSLKLYRRWEKGEGRMWTKHFLAIAQGYNISLDWLADGAGTPFRRPVSSATLQKFKAACVQVKCDLDRKIDRLNHEIAERRNQ